MGPCLGRTHEGSCRSFQKVLSLRSNLNGTCTLMLRERLRIERYGSTYDDP